MLQAPALLFDPLAAMVGRLTTGRKEYAGVDAEFRALTEEAESLRVTLRKLVDEDARAYSAVSAAYKLPKDAPERVQAIDDALLAAAVVPLDTARAAARVATLAQRAAEAGNKNAVSDAGVAALLATVAVRGACYNVEINVAGLSDPTRGAALRAEARKLAQKAVEAAGAAEARVLAAARPA